MCQIPQLTNQMRMSDWANLRSEFVWIYEGSIEPCYHDAKNHQPGQSALLILDGIMTVNTNKGVAKAKKGQWCFPTQGQRRQRFSKDTCVLSIHFKLNWPGGQPLFDSDVAIILDASDYLGLEQQARALYDVVKTQLPGAASDLPWLNGDIESHFILQNEFSAWLCVYVKSIIASGVTPSRLGLIDDRVLHVVQIIDHLPIDATLKTRSIAADVGLSPSQMDRIFTKQFNLTPRQYYERRKLQQAVEMIKGTPLSIKQIAYEMGFQSLPYFSRWFSQKTGLSPRQFQQLHLVGK